MQWRIYCLLLIDFVTSACTFDFWWRVANSVANNQFCDFLCLRGDGNWIYGWFCKTRRIHVQLAIKIEEAGVFSGEEQFSRIIKSDATGQREMRVLRWRLRKWMKEMVTRCGRWCYTLERGWGVRFPGCGRWRAAALSHISSVIRCHYPRTSRNNLERSSWLPGANLSRHFKAYLGFVVVLLTLLITTGFEMPRFASWLMANSMCCWIQCELVEHLKIGFWFHASENVTVSKTYGWSDDVLVD